MAVLRFSAGPDSVLKLHDVLVCLGKFSEAVAIEANNSHLVLTALNSTKSAYGAYVFSADKFFIKYSYTPSRAGGQLPKEKFTCKIYNKALLSVFKGRAVDPMREKDTGIETCDVTIEDGDEDVKSRVVVKIMSRHGILKTHRLTFESAPSMHALFNADMARNRWSISSRTLREFVEHFGPKTEQLDIYSEDGRVSFTSYTEKVMAGNEMLKKPLHTSIAIETSDFSEFTVEEKLHIAISVKDFKAIVTHAGILNTTVSAIYSHPSKPMQLKYSVDGITCEFILMTIGEYRGGSTTPAPTVGRSGFTKGPSRQPLDAAPSWNRVNSPASMPPPIRSAIVGVTRENIRNRVPRPSPPPPQPSLDHDSLFMPEADDRRWDPQESGDEEEEMLGWDASNDNDASAMTLNRSFQGNTVSQSQNINGRQIGGNIQRIEPTQRLSQIRSIFDE